MLSYKYSYLLGCLILTLIWAVLFKRNNHHRTEMIIIGVLGVAVGPVINAYFYRSDWWAPLYAFSLADGFGIEDFIFSFTVSGIISVVYNEFFNKHYKKNIEYSELNYSKALLIVGLYVLFSLIPLLVTFYVLKLNSFWSTSIGLFFGGIMVLVNRPDLLKDAVWTAILTPLIVLPAFIIPEMFSPGWVANYWYMENLSGIIILSAPLEDLIWFSLSGFCFGAAFEFLFDYKIKD